MGILTLLCIIVVIGLIVYGIRRFIPMDPPFKTMVLVVGIVVAFIIILNAFGILPIGDIAVPKLR